MRRCNKFAHDEQPKEPMRNVYYGYINNNKIEVATAAMMGLSNRGVGRPRQTKSLIKVEARSVAYAKRLVIDILKSGV